MVLVSHAHQIAGLPNYGIATRWLTMSGQAGVVLFFALSGFLLYLPWARSHAEGRPAPTLRTYAARRCLRIMPTYYASVVLIALGMYVAGQPFVGGRNLLFHFVFLPMLSTVYIQGVYWSLQVEEFFYWGIPLLHRLFSGVGVLRGALACVAISVVYGLACWGVVAERHLSFFLTQTPFYLAAFGCGIASALLWVRQRTAANARWMAWGGIAAYLAYALVVQPIVDAHPDLAPVGNVCLGPIFSLVVLGVARGGIPALSTPWLRFIGIISYSVYLWHGVVLRVGPSGWSFPATLLYTLAVAIPVSTLSYLLIERPFLKMRPHDRAAPAPAPQGAAEAAVG
jgi:peptidoglycan/LPS O-acetylase OafA/YrhL